MNHTDQPQDVTITSSLVVRSYTWITPEGAKPLTLAGTNTKVHLGGFEGAIVEWKQ